MNFEITRRIFIKIFHRWKAPVSIAIYAPGTDFDSAVSIILFLRNCISQSSLVKEHATFHVFMELTLMPKHLEKNFDKTEKSYVCPMTEPSFNGSFKSINNLDYPINTGRNFARESALTRLIFVSDIELYPSTGFVENFMVMIAKDPELLKEKT
jgi:beta-1,4-glucuronyltransferase 1